jgi:hypothetical protein
MESLPSTCMLCTPPRTALRTFTPSRDQLVICGQYVISWERELWFLIFVFRLAPLALEYLLIRRACPRLYSPISPYRESTIFRLFPTISLSNLLYCSSILGLSSLSSVANCGYISVWVRNVCHLCVCRVVLCLIMNGRRINNIFVFRTKGALFHCHFCDYLCRPAFVFCY